MPGYGHTDFKPGLAALKEIGYSDYLAFECGVPGDPFEEFPKAMDYIRSEWEKA
jgi:sugar phosphate isomerase/epimerase